MKLLRIDSSARGSSISRRLTFKFVEIWKRINPDGEVIERDLASITLPLITDEWVQGVYADSSKLTAAHQKALEVSHTFIGELEAADTIVIGAPMYNFTISAALKGWIDQVVRVGRTIAYGPNGRTGMLKGKRVVVITSLGGSYAPTSPAARSDFQEPYLRHVLGFMGMTDVTFVHAENQQGGELAELSRTAALQRIEQVVAEAMSASQHVPA